LHPVKHALAGNCSFITLYPFTMRTFGLTLTRRDAAPSQRKKLLRYLIIALGFWLASTFFLDRIGAADLTLVFWSIFLLVGTILYGYGFFVVLPKSSGRERPFRDYVGAMLLVLLIAVLPIGFFGLELTDDIADALSIVLLNFIVHIFFTVPLTWFAYRRHLKHREAVHDLEKELSQSTASFDFLRSQINPHFLFNTLNTLYGTALQEKSERTAHGIQLLGDMMRFMLHENHRDKIRLEREVAYMRNYMELQSLRTASSPEIEIETQIDDVPEQKFIAPMLLIPLVENAFKHGISLQHKSWIRVTLRVENDRLLFDVFNSVHENASGDRERDHAGIGLENVRLRLGYLYPGQHELKISRNPESFFVRLALQL
jgi:two-component system LytT family sensor kinase